ncbi:HAD-IA family hydrolase [Mangrovicella endophytica]|uniref:HAD-IA family hydrolase n=1 Tax=Mangrovicella endophytica TaxID=2066697 RepID=UPI0018E47FC4|nr:HAD-IA family hydrolase [Mangrovicella endophytica]
MNAFIFDVDGTLAETEELHRTAFNQAFAEAGLGWNWDEALYGELLKVSGGKERLHRYIETLGPDAPELPLPAAELVPKLHARKTVFYGEGVTGGALKLRPGIANLVAEAKRRGVRLAIATTTTRENVDALLTATLGTIADFEVFACGDMAKAKKPAPDIYHLALRELDLPAAACLAFEDSENGLRAAKAAGLRCVVTPALYTRGEDFSAADLVADDLTSFEPIFALLGERRSA